MTDNKPESEIRVACLQMEPHVGDKAGNVARSLQLIERAAEAGARLAVLPELTNSGYVFATREEAFSLAESVPGGPTTQAWAEAARKHEMVIAAGICERDGDVLYNAAVVLGPDGFIG